MPHWRVELYVSGPVTVRGHLDLREPKGWDTNDPFYSDILVRNTRTGAIIDVTARADNGKLARRAALYYVGQALDVLALDIRLPLSLSLLAQQPNRPEMHTERRIVGEEEWHHAFESARDLNQNSTVFLRALSWYRKGLYTEDVFDRFLALWNSVETVTSKYYPEGTCDGRGSKCHMWECFKQVWGECDGWPVISGKTTWIDENYETRKNIAHGVMPVNIRRVEEVLEKLETIEAVAYNFLSDWRSSRARLTMVPNPNAQ